MGVKCFLLEPVAKIKIDLRRYIGNSECPANGYHDNSTFLGEFDFPIPERGQYESWTDFEESLRPPKDDTRWPVVCSCGFEFKDAGCWQMFTERLMKRSDTGELTTLRDAPGGAIWRAWWYPKYWDNQEDDCLMVKLPNGHDWCVDSRASNCTMPDDRMHRCWVRTGTPPNINVDKNGFTCAAGAGSIVSGNWHGFLRNGELIQC